MDLWLDRLARRLALSAHDARGVPSLERVATALAEGADEPRLTRRRALQGAAAGATTLSSAAAVLAQDSRSCVGLDPECARAVEATYEAAGRRCRERGRAAGALWVELRCQTVAYRERERSRATCRAPVDSLCPPGEHCDASGRCFRGAPSPQPTAEPSPQAPPPVLASPCAADPVTPEAIEAAGAALAAGATDVALSSGGCLRYRRTLQGGRLVADEVVAGGRWIRRATYGENAADGEIDWNYDGVADERMSYRLTSGTVTTEEVLIERFAPSGRVVGRQRRTRASTQPDVIRVVSDEENPATGTLHRRQWDGTPHQAAGGTGRRGRAAPCTADQEALYRGATAQCVSQGLPCLKSHGAPATSEAMGRYAAGVQFNCVPGLGVVAHADWAWNPFGVGDSPTISIDPDEFGKLSPAQQAGSICHELMHFAQGMFGMHNPLVLSSGRASLIDPIYACQQLCFGDNPTACQCASCLRTHKCDPACAGYEDCNPDLGAECGCPCRVRFYETRTQCEVECPSGLCCFAFRCFPHDVSCP